MFMKDSADYIDKPSEDMPYHAKQIGVLDRIRQTFQKLMKENPIVRARLQRLMATQEQAHAKEEKHFSWPQFPASWEMVYQSEEE